MADDLEKRVSAKFILDSTGFNSGIQGINQQLKLAQSELKATSERLGVFGTETDKLRANAEGLSKQIDLQRQKVDIYKNSIDNTTQKLQVNIKARDELKKSLEEANIKYTEAVKLYGKESDEATKAKLSVEKLTEEYKQKVKQVESNAKAINNYTVNMNKADAELSKLQGNLQKTNVELDKTNSGWLKASDTLNKSGENFKKVGSELNSAGDTVLKLSAPLVGVSVAAVKVGNDFEAQMSRVKAISGATGDSFEQLNEQALKLGADTAFSAKEAAAGMENLASAGFSVNEIMVAMPGMLDLAASGGLDVANASDIASSALRGFSIDASQTGHVADVLAKVAAETNAQVEDMGLALKYASPPAHALGMSIEEVSAAVGLMSNAGIKGEQAGTTLRGVLVSLASPSSTAADMIQSIGFNAFDSSGKMLPFGQVIENLRKSTQNLTEEEKANALATIFGRESLSGMMVLMDSGKPKFDELTQSFKDSDGAAKDMAKTMQDNAKSSIEQMTGSLETAGIKLQQALAPSIKSVADSIGNLADKFGQLSPETQKTIMESLALAVGLGGVLKVTGGVVTGVGNVVTVAGKLSGAFGKAKLATEAVGTASAVAGGVGGVGGLGTALGGVAVAAAPWLIAGAAVVGTGYLINKSMSEEAIPSVDLFADKVKRTATSVNGTSAQMSVSYETSVTKISEATKKAVGAYMDLDNQASLSLTNLYVNSTTITEQTTTNMIGKYSIMATQIKTGMDNHHQQLYSDMQTFFTNSSTLTDTEEKEALAKLQQNNSDQKAEVDKNVNEIQSILKKASDEKRSLTLEEQQKINEIQGNMKKNAVKSLSDGEVESKIIIERLKEYDKRITAEQASEVIKNAEKQRKDSVEKANQQYDETVKNIIKMRDETGVLTGEQADKLIADAQRQRDDSITKADEMKNGVVDKIKSMNSDMLNDIDTTDGSIKTKWDKLKEWFANNPIIRWIKTMTSGDSSANVGHNWTGTNYWRGGLTYLHDAPGNSTNYELYDLPQGTRIYNHDASQDLVLKTAQSVATQVAQSVLDNLNRGNNGVSVTQHIYSPTSSPSEIARQTKNNLQQLALSW